MVIKVGVEPDVAKRIRGKQGSTIRKVRELRGLTIEELAVKVAVSPGAVSQWECGRFTPRQHLQIKLASVLDVPWSTLFGLDGEAA